MRSRAKSVVLLLMGLFLAAVSNKAFAKAEKIRVAILDFTSTKPEVGWLLPSATSQFGDVVTKLKRYQVFERDALQQILKEQALGQSGTMDDKTAAKIGKLAGVEQIIIPQISEANISRETINVPVHAPGGGLLTTFDGKTNKIVTEEKWKVKGNLKVSFRFVNVETGEISAQGSLPGTFDETFDKGPAAAVAAPSPTAAGESESMKMMKMMMEHQEEMERIRAGQPAKAQAAAPTAVPPPSLWDSYRDLGDQKIRAVISALDDALFNSFPLTGQVLQIQDPKDRKCVIDIGGSVGVKKGDDYEFLDGNGLGIGSMEIKEVGETASVAKYQKDERLIPGVKIRAKPRKPGFLGF